MERRRPARAPRPAARGPRTSRRAAPCSRGARRTRPTTRARRKFAVATAVAAVFTLALVAIPLLAPLDPNATDLARAYRAPGQDGFLLGSDSVGRDVLLRTLFGGSESVALAFAIVAAAFALGTAVGLVAGLAGGAVDAVLDKAITMFQAFPSFVLALALAAILGQGALNMVVAVVAVKWTEFARLARQLALSLKNTEAVESARVAGSRLAGIARRYLMPNMAGPLAVMAALGLGDTVLTMAGLSFLGLGPGRPTNEWGAMMSEASSSFQFAPWCLLVPGVALFVAVTIFSLLGDTLRDALDVAGADEFGAAAASGPHPGQGMPPAAKTGEQVAGGTGEGKGEGKGEGPTGWGPESKEET